MAKSGLHGVDRTSSGSMLAIPKYKRKEERKKILKMCVKKLRSIDDPETFLCRSVLINNTLKQIQAFHKAKEASKHAHAHHQVEWEQDVREREDNKEGESEESESPTSSDTEEPYEQNLASRCEPEHHLPLDNTRHHTDQTQHHHDVNLASRSDNNDYNAEDILSDILLPPPLSPRLEDITDCRIDTDFSLSVSSSLLSTNWAHEDALDWVAVNSHNKWPGIPASDDLKSTLDVSVINDICDEAKSYTDLSDKYSSHAHAALCDETEAVVPNNKEDSVDDCFDDSSDNSSDTSGSSEDRTGSEGDHSEFEFSSCGRSVSYMADIQTVVLNNLIASLESWHRAAPVENIK